MKVREFLAQMGNEFLELEAVGLVLVAATSGVPTVASTVPPDLAIKLLSLVVDDGDWSDIKTLSKLY